MPTLLNPDHLGEFAKLYYIIGVNAPVTTTIAGAYPDNTEDQAVLTNANWEELCVVSVSPSSSINNYEVQDRCVGNVVGNTPGRENFTFDVTINQMRLGDDVGADAFPLLAFMQAMDTRQIISFLA